MEQHIETHAMSLRNLFEDAREQRAIVCLPCGVPDMCRTLDLLLINSVAMRV